MEAWDQDYVDMEVESFIRFDQNKTGEFQFGLVRGFLHWRIDNDDRKSRLEFTWEGSDELDPVNGGGWAETERNILHGCIHIHLGDTSGFTASKKPPE